MFVSGFDGVFGNIVIALIVYLGCIVNIKVRLLNLRVINNYHGFVKSFVS